MNKRTYRLCPCGGKDTEEHLLFGCNLNSALTPYNLDMSFKVSLKICRTLKSVKFIGNITFLSGYPTEIYPDIG